ncbi:MAG: hypothetical protein WD940_00565, partial [Patescibacteria group bacterium]
ISYNAIRRMSTDLRQTDSWAKYLGGQGWGVEELKVQGSNFKVKAYIIKIPWVGSVVKIQRPDELPPQEEIDRIAKKHHALFVKIEPLYPIPYTLYPSFELDPNPNLLTKTIAVDLAPGERILWKNLAPDARQSVRKARRQKLRVESCRLGDPEFGEKLRKFQLLLAETGKRQHFGASSHSQLQAKVDAFGKDAILFLVFPPSNRQDPLAGALLFLSGETAFYHHTASSKAGKKLFASYLLMWEIFKELRDKRPEILYLEFEGITDPRFPQTKRWERFTVFKRKWGGREIEFPPPLIKHYHPLVKALFRLSQKIAVV